VHPGAAWLSGGLGAAKEERRNTMLGKLASYTLVGIEATPVEVEVDVSYANMPKTVLVGLAEAAVKESTHRVERAIVNSGYRRPLDRVVINLAPADLKKDASGFDLPIALGCLLATGQLSLDRKGNFAVVGELALTGETRPIKGALAMALAAAAEGRDGLLVSAANAAEAAVVEGVAIYPVGSLAEAVGFLSGQLDIEPTSIELDEVFRSLSHTEDDFSDVKGQDYAKRALVIAASGGHNVLMIGPPGTGKTLLAKRLGSIMPPLTPADSLETTRIYSAMGLLRPGQPLMAVRPFRAPHHSVSDAGLVGGGTIPQPGEISLSHKGVLFLDELPEFNRKTLEVLRQPLEDGKVTISRALRATTFPADFVLVAAMNPCPCGYRSDPRRACTCSPPQVEKYLSKISGPLLDRIDLHVEVPAVPFTQLAEAPPGPTSADLLRDVLRARERQIDRFGGKGPTVNGRMTPRQVRKYCTLKRECSSLLKGAMEELGLSARAHDKILRVARTMADLEGTDEIQPNHVAEAVGFRALDRSVWS
jgi:magnesium chelatase family protein